MRRPTHLSLAALVLALCALLPSRARALTVTDPGSGFHVALDVPGDEVCAAYPASLRNTEACPDLIVPPASSFADASERGSDGAAHTAGVVYFVQPDWHYFAVVVVTPMPGNTRLSASEVDEYLGGVRSGMPGHLPAGVTIVPNVPANAHDELEINGLQVLRNVVELSVPPGDPPPIANRMLMYHVVGRGSIVAIMYSCDASQLALVQAQADAMVRSVVMPRPPTHAEQIGRAVGVLVGCAGVPLVIGLVVWSIASRRRARDRAMGVGGIGQPGGPMGWPQQPPPGGAWPPGIGGYPGQGGGGNGGWPQGGNGSGWPQGGGGNGGWPPGGGSGWPPQQGG